MAGLVANEPFEAMSKNPNIGQIQEYLDRGFNIDTKDRNERTLMSHAIDNDLPEVVQMLIQRGADLRDSANLVQPQQDKLASVQVQKKNFDREVVQEASGSDNFSYITRLKKQRQAQIDEQEEEIINTNLNSILYYAVRKNRVGILELLLKRGVRFDRAYPDNNKLSLLHLASVHQDGKIVKLLLDRGIDPNIQDSLGCTPLHTAIVRDLMPYTPRLSNHIANIANSSVSKQAISYLVQAGAKSDTQCYLSRGDDRHNFYYLGSKIDSVAKLIRSKNSNSENVYDYSSPGQLLLIFGITDIDLNSANQKK